MASSKKDGDKQSERADEDLDTSERTSEPLTGNKKARQSEFAVSRGGMNQESRQHNKPRPDADR